MLFAKISTEILWLLLPVYIAGACVFVLGIIQIFLWRRQKKKAKELIAATEAEYKRWLQQLAESRQLQTIETPLCLSGNERCYYQSPATLCEPRSIRNTTHVGGGVHIAKGVTIGGANSITEIHDEWRELSKGMFYITNKRIIFDGDMYNRAASFSSMISVVAEPLRLAVSTTSRQKTMLFSNLNGKMAAGIIKILRSSK